MAMQMLVVVVVVIVGEWCIDDGEVGRKESRSHGLALVSGLGYHTRTLPRL
jgi:hypothetical protein